MTLENGLLSIIISRNLYALGPRSDSPRANSLNLARRFTQSFPSRHGSCAP